MDATVVGYILAGIAGIGGAGLVIGRGAIVARGGGGSGMPGPDDTGTEIPWWLGGPGPVILGLILAEIVWILIAPDAGVALDAITPTVVGLTSGAAGATLLRLLR